MEDQAYPIYQDTESNLITPRVLDNNQETYTFGMNSRSRNQEPLYLSQKPLSPNENGWSVTNSDLQEFHLLNANSFKQTNTAAILEEKWSNINLAKGSSQKQPTSNYSERKKVVTIIKENLEDPLGSSDQDPQASTRRPLKVKNQKQNSKQLVNNIGCLQRGQSLFGQDSELSKEYAKLQSMPSSDHISLLNKNLNPWYSDEEKAARIKARHRKSLKNLPVRKSDPSSPNLTSHEFRSAQKAITTFLWSVKKSSFVFKPDGKFKITWDMIGMMFILYEVIMIPFKISFDVGDSSGLDLIELILDVFFLTDIVLSFNTGYYYRGHLEVGRTKIAKNYLQRWFWIDLFASFPYARVIENANSDDSVNNQNTAWIRHSTRILRLIRFLRFVRIVRLIRIFKLKSIFGKLESFISLSPSLNAFTGFLRLSAIILFIAHWIACFWHLIGDLEVGNDPESWLIRHELYDRDWTSKYLASIYFAVTTMITVGYGDITPATDSERIYVVFTMLIASGVFAYSMNSINSLLVSIDVETQEFKNTIVWVERYMRKMNLDIETRLKVKRYLEYTLVESSSRKDDENRLLSLLSDSLKDEVIKKINKNVLTVCESFEKFLRKTFSEPFLKEMIYFFHERVYSPEELIFHEERDEEASLYMIVSGTVNAVLLSHNHGLIRTYEKGDNFGEIEFVTGMNRKWSAQAGASFVSLFYLRRRDFIDLINNFLFDKERFYQLKDEITLYNDHSAFDYKCFFCKKNAHLPLGCPFMHYIVDKEKILKKTVQENYRFMKCFQRRPRAKFSVGSSQLQKSAIRIRANYQKDIDAFENQLINIPQDNDYLRKRSGSLEKISDLPNVKESHSALRTATDIGDYDDERRQLLKLKSKNQQTLLEQSTPFEVGFDLVYNFKEYFPHNNITNIAEGTNKKHHLLKKFKRNRVLRRILSLASLRAKKPASSAQEEIYSITPIHDRRATTGGNIELTSMGQKTIDGGEGFVSGFAYYPEVIEDEEVSLTVSTEKIADEKMNLDTQHIKENDDSAKNMQFKLMSNRFYLLSSGESTQNLNPQLIKKDQLYTGPMANFDPLADIKDGEYRHLAVNTQPEKKEEEEVKQTLESMIAKYGAKYIQEILNQKSMV